MSSLGKGNRKSVSSSFFWFVKSQKEYGPLYTSRDTEDEWDHSNDNKISNPWTQTFMVIQISVYLIFNVFVLNL